MRKTIWRAWHPNETGVSQGPHLFTIAPGAHFAQSLAHGLKARLGGGPLDLSRSIIYLPTRRAARNFGEAFTHVFGGAALLPQFRALGDSDEDEINFDSAAQDIALPEAITPIRRQLLLATLVRQWDESARGGTLSFAQSFQLGESLATLMDEIERQDADLAKLAALAPPQLAAHWQDVTGFLGLIHTAWPGLLADEGRMNPAARRNQSLELLTQRLSRMTPDKDAMVIAAGSTGSIPATAKLLTAIARLPHGAVVLPGLDRKLDEKSWHDLDAGHPQYGMKQLLERMGAARVHVADWDEHAADQPRQTVLRESLRPAPTTDAWCALADEGREAIADGLDGLSLVAANDPAEEALVIALALRATLETPGRTAALVTPDRNLARRVANELTRWDIAIDDSAGKPLAHTGAGIFLSLLAEAAEERFAPVPLLALLKHPFATLGDEPAAFRQFARLLDHYVLRGPRPDGGLAAITKAIGVARQDKRKPGEKLAALAVWWQGVAEILAPLERGFARNTISLDELIRLHVEAAQKLACKPDAPCPLWQGPDGKSAAELMRQFLDAARELPAMEPRSYPALLHALAMKIPVRPQFSQHRAIAILGPLEARLQRFDLTILGGLNEGSWPATPPADPWFSRPMRVALDLEQPERRIGLAAHDFASLAAGPQVLLTRALKADGAPTIASRWLQRLTQLTRGLGLEDRLQAQSDYLVLARKLSQTPPAPRIARPAPTPPVSARPARLSVTEIETWLRDPYAIYARHVLKLRPLDGLDEAVGPLERGTALHRALELFVRDYPDTLPDDALAQLVARADQVFAELGIPKAQLAIWRPRFLGAAAWFIDYERARRPLITKSHLEIKGARKFGDFELTGVADRIDILASGGAAILDYKTGRPPSPPQIRQLLTPQLPLEAAILAAGGFAGLAKLTAQELIYLRLSGGRDGNDDQPTENVEELTARAIQQLMARIAWFNEPETPYRSRVQPYSADSVGDYDHLARVREWSPSGWSEEP